jgi:Kef-type K+ transport system membrane component KefB
MSGWLVVDPLARFLAQAIAIIVVSRLLGLVARRVSQPIVIAEIVAGVVLGPSLLGLVWPEAGAFLFPRDALDLLQIVSQLGLVLFMFMIGLELDLTVLRGRGQSSVAISFASMVASFALGAGLAVWLYPRLAVPGVPMLSFLLFLGVAMSITAFPVLARILIEHDMLKTRVGTVAIASAAVGDVTAWCLLALVVAAARAHGFAAAGLTTGITVVYIAAMVLVARPLLDRLGARIATREDITHNVFAAIIALLLLSSLVTQLVGIHALFGAFLFGAMVPERGGLARALAEKLEGVVTVVLLPLFFAYSGVRTQIGLLDTADAWLICGLIIVVACVGKFGGTAIAARLSGLPARESVVLGVLMNTRGLMELIVLNIGLELGVISHTLFTMMVLMALVTTFMTSPILERVYPASRREPA